MVLDVSLHLLQAQALNGLALGAILALVALGLTIVFGLLGFVNFAHGTLFMVGAYAGWLVYSNTNDFWLALPAALVVTFLLGLVIERVLIRMYYNRPPEDQILVTYGLAIVLVEVVRAIFTGQTKLLTTPSWAAGIVQIAGIYYPQYRVAVMAISAVTLLVVYLVLFRTRIGLIVRAGIDDAVIVNILGINVNRTFMLVFALGAAIAGLSGIVDAPLIAVNPDMGTDLLVQCFVVVVIGGVGSFFGAILGGIVAGEIISLTTAFAPDYASVMLYVAMAVVLIVRPQGLLGVEGRA
ncbi:MAG TPA: branched-chain amino acid ABC transporter permease [Candidatus Acidoferrales bacterium]|nr:branched-chain amino acid ABC transporter permease [Candidatus Acidoferrales bacterium]